MRVVVQRVSKAKVFVGDELVSSIEQGLLILLGIEHEDTSDDSSWLTNKISKLRLFNDENGVMNKSISEVKGEAIVVSQFTLHASTRKGNRPSYIKAARPEKAQGMYDEFIAQLSDVSQTSVYGGQFGAMMDIELVNDGPVTIIVDSKLRE